MALSKLFAAGANDATSGTVLTTASFDSTGYTHIVMFGKWETTATTYTLSDNKGSTGPSYLTMMDHGFVAIHAQLSWMPIASPGTGHTVTMTLAAAREYRGMVVWLVNATSGSIALDVQSVADGSGSTVDAGSLVTTTATASFMGVGEYTSGTFTQGSGWTEDYDSSHYGQSRTDASGTLDPVCTWTATGYWVACAASFKEVAGSGTKPMFRGS